MIAKQFTIFTFFITNIIFAQHINLQVLEKMTDLSHASFDTQATRLNFTYAESKNFEYFTTYTYINNPNSGNQGTRFLMYSQFGDYYSFVRSIEFQTLDQAEYLNIKQQIENGGYKYIELSSYNNKNYFVYDNGIRKIEVGNNRIKKNDGTYYSSFIVNVKLHRK